MNAVGNGLPADQSFAGRGLKVVVYSRFFWGVLWFSLFEWVFYIGYRYGMSFSQVMASPFWFPDSVLLCALLLSPPRTWWVYILGALPIRLFSEVAHGIPTWFLLTTFAIDSAKALITATVVRRFVRNPVRMETVNEFALFCLFAVLLVPAASAFGGAAARHALGHEYWTAWEQWFMGDALAQLILTPAILYWIFGFRADLRKAPVKRYIEGGILGIGLILTCLLAFHTGDVGGGFMEARFFAPVPFLFWAAVRFGMPGASGAIIIIAFLSVEAALAGAGPFSNQPAAGTASALQHFLLLRAAPLYLVAILIEQRKKVEISLEASEERYRELVESQTDLVCRYLPDTTLTFVNEAYCRFFGKPRDQLMGQKHLDLIPTTAREGMLEQVATAIREPGAHILEHEVLLPDGTVGWQQWVTHAICAQDGTVIELQGVGRDVTDRKRAEDTAREVSGRLITAQEDERKRIARDLHDDLNQQLAILSIQIELLAGQHPGNLLQTGLEEIGERINNLSSSVRQLSYRLHPAKIDQLGLVTAGRRLCEEMAHQAGIQINFRHHGIPRDIDPNLSLCLYRVLQEGLQNCIRHSQAREACAELKIEANQICLTISDAGKGFDLTKVSREGGLGLISMRERLRQERGTFKLDSSPGQGTRVEVRARLKSRVESAKP